MHQSKKVKKKRKKIPTSKSREIPKIIPLFLETSRLQERGKVFLDQLCLTIRFFSVSNYEYYYSLIV